MRTSELPDAMGTWLGGLVPWDVFSTWTFSRPVTVAGAMFCGRRHLRRLQEMAAQPVYAFVGVERGGVGGLLHLHALVGNVGHLKPYCGKRLQPGAWGFGCCMMHAWPCGYARVSPYDPELGARFYVSKYVVKRLAEWNLFGFPVAAQLPLAVDRKPCCCCAGRDAGRGDAWAFRIGSEPVRPSVSVGRALVVISPTPDDSSAEYRRTLKKWER